MRIRDAVSHEIMQVSKPSGMLMNPPHRYDCSNDHMREVHSDVLVEV